MADTTSGSDSLASFFGSFLSSAAQVGTAALNQSANNASATANAQSAEAALTLSTTTKTLLYAGAGIVLLVVVFLILRRR